MATTNQVLVVTGGGRGIGAAIVRRAVADGHAVCFSYARDSGAAERLAAELGERAFPLASRVEEPADVTALFDAATARFGPVTGLVNNAGTTGRIAAFADLEVELLRRVLDVNVLGTMLCAREAVRRWRDADTGGTIINLSSSAATLGSPGEYVNYAASKAAVDAFTMGLAKELGPTGIRVNAVAPGITDTEIHAAGGMPDRAERVAPRVPLGRVARPDEVANAVAWLLSPESAYVTGAILRVAGGL